jgi:hypothetical protein
MNGDQMGLVPLSTHLDLSSPMVMELERVLVARGFVELTKTGRELTGMGVRRVRQIAESEKNK